MVKFFSALVAALLSFTAISAHAGLGRLNLEQQVFRDNEGEPLIINNLNGDDEAHSAVTDTMLRSGYRMVDRIIEPGTKMDTWCKIDIHVAYQILVACYTPASLDHRITVSKYMTRTQEQFKDGYADVPALVSELRAMHRRAAAALSQRPAQVLFVPTF